ncbi:MAG: hypothetical protein WCC11_05070 [Gammaproteobacteria bacterium]
MNSNNVVFNKSQDMASRDTTDVVFWGKDSARKQNLGITEIKDSNKKKFVMASVAQCDKALSAA